MESVPQLLLRENNIMEATQLLQSNLLDILFEGKNKSYGAYELRVHYKRRLIISIFIILSISILFCSIFLIPFHAAKTFPVIQTIEVSLKNAETKKDELKLLKTVEEKQVATRKPDLTTPIIIKEPVTPLEKPEKQDESIVNIAAISQGGENIIYKNPPLENHGTGAIAIPLIAKDIDSIYYDVKVVAQFPGGPAAWQRYLERNLDMDIPERNGAPAGKYTLYISFIVDKDGNISNASALNDPGYGLASEAIRVIAKSKQWIPAIQNGRNVKYRQVQPVTFMINDN